MTHAIYCIVHLCIVPIVALIDLSTGVFQRLSNWH